MQKVLKDFYACTKCGYRTKRYYKTCPKCGGAMQHVVTVKKTETRRHVNPNEIRLWKGLFKVRIVKRFGVRRCEVEALEGYGNIQKGTRWITFESNLQISIKKEGTV